MIRNIGCVNLFFILICSSLNAAYKPTDESNKILSFEVGYVGLFRSPLKNMSFLTKTTTVGGTSYETPIFHKINFNYVSGIRALIEWNQGQKNSVEAIYTGLFNWRNEDSTTSSSNLLNVYTPPYFNEDWYNFNYFQYHYKSELNSAELSYWRHVTPRYVDYFSFSWMLGLRYIDFRDKLSMNNSTGSVNDTASVDVINQMGGGQLGLELQCNTTKRFTWALQVKGGAYADFAQRKTVFYDQDETELLINSKQSRVEKDYTLELMPYILYRLNPVYFRLAYDRIVMFNPVFAPLQLKSSKSVDEIYTHNYVNFQAIYASIGVSW